MPTIKVKSVNILHVSKLWENASTAYQAEARRTNNPELSPCSTDKSNDHKISSFAIYLLRGF